MLYGSVPIKLYLKNGQKFLLNTQKASRHLILCTAFWESLLRLKSYKVVSFKERGPTNGLMPIGTHRSHNLGL